MKRVGIFGGSFNPVHRGHTDLAQWLVAKRLFDEVWFLLSPLNPLKANAGDLAPDADRAAMLQLALQGHPGLKPCLVELSMPRPSYTINTLRRLAETHPGFSFSLIIGSDNWQIFNRWREADAILADFGVTVYPRPGYDVDLPMPRGARFVADAPVADVSSTALRAGSADAVRWLHPDVRTYISDHNLYQ